VRRRPARRRPARPRPSLCPLYPPGRWKGTAEGQCALFTDGLGARPVVAAQAAAHLVLIEQQRGDRPLPRSRPDAG
jgi:hypothetical protein